MSSTPNPPSKPKRVTRSMSHQPSAESINVGPVSSTTPGPPVSLSDSHTTIPTSTDLDVEHPSNPFQVDFVIPYDVSIPKGAERMSVQEEIKEGYEGLLRGLEGEGGLKVGSRKGRGGKGAEEVWVFVGIIDEKLAELVERESLMDKAHGLPSRPTQNPATPSTKLRLLYALLTAPPIQHGLGITPGHGEWKRVKSIMALHDDEADKRWIERWTGKHWKIGILSGLSGQISIDQPPPVHLYFDFLSTYSRSLVPLSLISLLIFFVTPKDSYPPIYAFILSLYSATFVAYWRVRERKFAVNWGTRGVESVAVGRLRPEYVANLTSSVQKRDGGGGGDTGGAVDAVHAGDRSKRDVKMATSIPVIAFCGVGLGVLLMGIFILEAFVGEVYDGFGKEVVPLIPTALFALVVPQIVGAYQLLAKKLVQWEDHPTPVGAEKSLTAKTFAVNGIVAYLGLFLTAYVYVPFGSFIMRYVQTSLASYQGSDHMAKAAGEVKLGPRSTAATQHNIKAGRLKGQLFAYTVTNQVINMFLELGLPFILRFINDWRAGKTTLKQAVKTVKSIDLKNLHAGHGHTPAVVRDAEEAEKRFMDKVERELALPDYNLFTDYAEMVTQFGYVTIWSIVWPLAPIFALINNYIELRADAVKISKHVRRPVGDRVETIGSWLETLSIISWIGAVVSSTLIYLFRPTHQLAIHSQTPNPNVPPYPGSAYLSTIITSYSSSPTIQTVLPTLVPLALVALAASHGFIMLRWVVEAVVEKLVWRGSKEEMEVEKLRAKSNEGIRRQLEELSKREDKRGELAGLRGGFWNGGEEGAREIGRAIKVE